MNIDSLVKYRVLRSMTHLIDSSEIRSLTDFMLKTINRPEGKIVGTEVYLTRDNLCGKIDVLRKVKNGYIIQEEKTKDPPEGKGVWKDAKLQVDAYAFLAEGNNFSPVISGIIIYNDLKPRKVKPNPRNAENILNEVMWLLDFKDVLPKENDNKNTCKKCSYYALCQVLPPEGGLKATDIRNAFAKQLRQKEIIQEH